MHKLLTLAVFAVSALAQSGLDSARNARDSGDAATLRARIAESRKGSSLESLLRMALLDSWLCEALYSSNDTQGVKRAAQEGIGAAERAVRLAPNSSEAHRLLGDLLSQLIPNVFAGGVRYGKRSTNEVDQALAIDPRNVDAHIARATSYFFTPAMFGGDKQKAIEHLRKALEIDPNSDTAHLWLAQVYADLKQKDAATVELNAALRINPRRGYTRFVATEIGAAR